MRMGENEVEVRFSQPIHKIEWGPIPLPDVRHEQELVPNGFFHILSKQMTNGYERPNLGRFLTTPINTTQQVALPGIQQSVFHF